MVNGGKTVVEIDLKSEDGKRDFRALVERSDAFLESYRPGVLDRLGFGHAALHEMNPGIVSCSLSGWGLEGPYRLRGGHDINYMGLMGGLERSGVPGRPIVAFPPTADFASGMQAALSIMGGLLGRSRNADGRGATIDVSIAETVLPWQVWALNGLFHTEWDAARGAQFPNGGAASTTSTRPWTVASSRLARWRTSSGPASAPPATGPSGSGASGSPARRKR